MILRSSWRRMNFVKPQQMEEKKKKMMMMIVFSLLLARALMIIQLQKMNLKESVFI